MYLKLEEMIPIMSKGLWMPMLAMRDINSQVFSYLNYLSYAAMFIPILAYSLVKASEQGFVNFMSSMGGASSNAGNTGASQKVTGANIGNTSVGKGSHTGINGTTTDMGGGAEDRNSNNYSSEGTYKDQTTQSSNGSTNSNLSNSVADITMKDNELSSVGYKNISSEITQTHQDSYNQAKATEKSSLESISNTLSSGISTSLAKGQIYTNSDDFAKSFGINKSDAQTIQNTWGEAVNQAISKRNSENETEKIKEIVSHIQKQINLVDKSNAEVLKNVNTSNIINNNISNEAHKINSILSENDENIKQISIGVENQKNGTLEINNLFKVNYIGEKTEKISKLSIEKLNKNLNDIKFMKENASEIHKELQFFQL